MTIRTRGLKDSAAQTFVSSGQRFGREFLFQTFNQVLLVLRRIAEFAPDLSETCRKFFVAEAADLAGLQSAEFAGWDFAGFDLVKECGGKGGASDEGFDDCGALARMKRGVV